MVTESNADTLRNVGLLIGGVLALVFGIWRARVAERQANAAQEQAEASQAQVEAAQLQVEIARQTLLNDRYQRAAELLGNETLAVRLSGIYALRRLSEEYPEGFHAQHIELLCAFVRNPTNDSDLFLPAPEDWHTVGPRVREDVQAAVSCIAQRTPYQVASDISLGLRIDLRGANLAGADLRGYRLDGADLTHATLAYAKLDGAFLVDAVMTNADFTGAQLPDAKFRSSICKWANFSSAKAQTSDFGGACLEGAILTGTQFEGTKLTNVILNGADLQGAKLTRAEVSGAFIGSGQSINGDPPYELVVYAHPRIIQEQLDEAIAASGNPPKIDPETTDMKTGEPLVWRDQTMWSS